MMINFVTNKLRSVAITGTIALAAAALLAASPVAANATESVPPPIQVEPINPNDPIQYSDGSIEFPQGYNARGIPSCGSQAYAPPGGSYGPVSQATCSLSGSPGARAGYTWQVSPHSNSTACSSGLGYNAANSPVYFGVGCGSSGSGNVTWGNVLGYQKLKAYATGLLTGAQIAWY